MKIKFDAALVSWCVLAAVLVVQFLGALLGCSSPGVSEVDAIPSTAAVVEDAGVTLTLDAALPPLTPDAAPQNDASPVVVDSGPDTGKPTEQTCCTCAPNETPMGADYSLIVCRCGDFPLTASCNVDADAGGVVCDIPHAIRQYHVCAPYTSWGLQ